MGAALPRRQDAADSPARDPEPNGDWITWKTGIVVIAVAAAMYVLHWASPVFIPIVVSILISYALEPVVRPLVKLHIPRPAAAALVVLVLFAGAGYSAYVLSDDATAVVSQLPEAAQKLRASVRELRGEEGAIQQVQKAAEEIEKTASEAAGNGTAPRGVQRVQVEEPALNLRQYVVWGPAGALALAGQAVVVSVFVFFLLASGDLFKRKLVRIAGPTLERRRITVQILDDINTQIEKVLRVFAIDGVIVAIASWLAFRAVGLEQAAFWGIAAGVFNIVPYFGPIIVAVGIGIVAFVQFGTIAMAAYVMGIAFLITSIEGWLILPLLTRRAARTNEVAVFVGLIFWTFIWGIWGTLLAVPMLVALKACCDRIDDLKPIGELLGD
jgi:predicted PurR-regulated permease PerM